MPDVAMKQTPNPAETEHIYYTGDMANNPGWFTVTGSRADHKELTEDAGGEDRVFMVPACGIGNEYHGHANPRFVTEAAYNAYRAACMGSLEAALCASREG